MKTRTIKANTNTIFEKSISCPYSYKIKSYTYKDSKGVEHTTSDHSVMLTDKDGLGLYSGEVIKRKDIVSYTILTF